MTRIVKFSAARLVAGLATALALPSTAGAWSFPIESASPGDAAIVSTSGNNAGQFWAVDDSKVLWLTLLHYNENTPTSSATLRANRFFMPLTTTQGDLIAVEHNDGATNPCTIIRYDADGRQRWRQTLDGACSPADPAGVRAWQIGSEGYWVQIANRFVRIAADGRVLRAPTDTTGSIEAVDPRNGNFYTTTQVVAGDAFVVAYDRDAKELWRTSVGAPVRIAVAADGSLRAFGAKQTIFLAALSTSGQLQWKTQLDPTIATQDPYPFLKAPLIDGNAATVILGGADDVAIRVDATGQVPWRVKRTAVGVQIGETLWNAKLAPNGDALFVFDKRVSRIDSTGHVRFSQSPTVGTQPTVGLRLGGFGADASALVLVLGENPANGKLLRLGVAGETLTAPQTTGVVHETVVASRATLPDGSIVAWTDSTSGKRELQRVDADGKLVWRQATPGTWSRPEVAVPAGGAIVAGDGRVCTLDGLKRDATLDHVLTCYRTTDGSTLWTRRLHEGARESWMTDAHLHAAADGSISAWYSFSTDGMQPNTGYARIDRDGNIVSSKAIAGNSLGETAVNSPYVFLRQGTDDTTAYNPDGSERYRFKAAPEFSLQGVFGADGSFVGVWTAGTSQTGNVVRYDAAGKQAWAKTLAGESMEKAPVIVGDSVFVTSCCGNIGTQRRVTRIKLADGAVAWQRDLPVLSGFNAEPAGLVATPQGDAVLSVTSSARTVDIDVLNTQDGTVRARRREACRSSVCQAMAPLVAGDRLHVLDASPAESSLISWRIQPAQNGLVRIDQSGLAGAWWAPYANGEGFVLDYLPASRTFFMPWFTFSRQGGNDPSGQRWYVVQGSVTANAKTAQLPITRAVGGTFDAGPVVPGEIVGTATVSFTDCNSGTLDYAFNEGVNGAAKGTISLSRLSPAAAPCTLADGTTQPVTVTPAANGFDARMSGSWFEEATSGQGLEFVIQPNGLYFAPWFTFDPAGPSDDPDRQRWFTLQGSLANARNGVVEAPIVQGIGGSFDLAPTSNTVLVGTSKLTFLGCDRATLEYRFDDNDLAGPMRKLAGAIDLVKIGGCAATP